MSVELCRVCRARLFMVPVPRGGRMPCEYAPGFIDPGQGTDFGYEPRNLARVTGRLVPYDEAIQRMLNDCENSLVRVWLPHSRRCRFRPSKIEVDKPQRPERRRRMEHACA